MIVLVAAADVAQGEDALLGMQIVEFEFAELNVQPGGSRQVIQSAPHRFEVEGTGVVRRWQNVKRNVFGQRACGMEIQAAPVKSLGVDLRLHSGSGRCAVYANAVCAFAMPVRGDAECYRLISRMLIDGSVALISHLVAVVLELLPIRTELRPGFMARRAGHAVLSRECRDSVHVAFGNRQSESGEIGYEQEPDNQESTESNGPKPHDPVTEQRLWPRQHSASCQMSYCNPSRHRATQKGNTEVNCQLTTCPRRGEDIRAGPGGWQVFWGERS